MFFSNPCQGRFRIPKSSVDSLPPPSYDLQPKYPLEIDTVTFVICIARVIRMMYCLLSNTKRKMMVAEAFVLFFPVTPELNGGS